nr:AMP-binding protein [Streptomyces sp. WM6378]
MEPARAEGLLTAAGAPFAVVRGEGGALEYASGPRTLREFVETVWAFGERPFLIAESGTYSYAEFFAASCALARRLTDVYGLRPGDRAVIGMRNHPEWQVAFWAAQLASLVAVPLNAWWTAEEFAYALDDCAPRVLLVDGERLERVAGWAAAHGVRGMVCHHAGGLPDGFERFDDLPELTSPDPAAGPPDVDVPPDADATIMYTSGTTGRPKVRIAGADGSPLADGEVGELWLRGQSLVRGYWNDPAATQLAFQGGWFRTGDLATLRDGRVGIVDRIKDMVIRGGENVYCVEVEGVLHDHPAVLDAAVVGVPHPVLGEEVGAVVQVRGGSGVSADALRAHVGAVLAGFKVPAHVVLREEALPRNATGKVLKRELRGVFPTPPLP